MALVVVEVCGGAGDVGGQPPAVGERRVVYIREDNIAYDVDPKFVQLDDPAVRLKPPYTVPN